MDGNVYEKALQVIRERGWCQGTHERGPGGPVCAQGALLVALFGDMYFDRPTREVSLTGFYETKQFLQNMLRERDAIPVLPIWNDHPGRTQQQVEDLLEEAALRARGPGPVEDKERVLVAA